MQGGHDQAVPELKGTNVDNDVVLMGDDIFINHLRHYCLGF